MMTAIWCAPAIGMPAAAQPCEPTPSPQYPLRVLVVDDTPLNQQLIVALLERFGCRTAVAGNGREALAALRHQPCDLVLMDVQMPEMNGLEATRRIRQEWPDAAQPRVIALTANVIVDEKETCLAAGMDDYLAKPVRVKELQEVLRLARDWHAHRVGHPVANAPEATTLPE